MTTCMLVFVILCKTYTVFIMKGANNSETKQRETL